MSYDSTKVTIYFRPNAFQVYGKQFKYPSHGHPDHYRLREQALRDAKQFGVEQLAVMQHQKGAPLSRREEMTGHLDPPPDTRPLAQRVREDVKLIEQAKRDPDRNPWLSRMDELNKEVALIPSDRAQLARRKQQVQAWSERWERERAEQRVEEKRAADPQLKNMREHAVNAYEYVRRDATAMADEVRERKRLLDLANSSACEPADYWPASNSADQIWFKRLDAIAEEKKVVLAEARSDHAEARQSAQSARGTDRAVDSPPSIADVDSGN
jgi:hypothetical protein